MSHLSFLPCSCSICKKKQNLHFIVPQASFKILQVTDFQLFFLLDFFVIIKYSVVVHDSFTETFSEPFYPRFGSTSGDLLKINTVINLLLSRYSH